MSELSPLEGTTGEGDLARSVIPALTVFAEAAGEPFEGKLGVAFVIAHRAAAARIFVRDNKTPHPLFGDGSAASACRVSHRGIWQFSCWGDARDMQRTLDADENTPGFVDCVRATILALNYRVSSPVGGALWYYNPDSVAHTPAWVAGIAPCARIGHHLFFDRSA